MDSFREVTSGLAKVRFNDGELPRETVAKVTLHRDPRDEFTQRVINREGSDITTGMAHVGGCEDAERVPTGYEDYTDEALAQQLGGIALSMLHPNSHAILREARQRLVARRANNRGQVSAKPTLEGLETRIERLERLAAETAPITWKRLNAN